MSRQNKVNPGRYTAAARLSPDDLSRERRRQTGARRAGTNGRTTPPVWETTAPNAKAVKAAKRKPAGRVKVAAARAAVGVTRAAAKTVKTVTSAARRALGTTKGASAKKTTTRRTSPSRAAAAGRSRTKR